MDLKVRIDSALALDQTQTRVEVEQAAGFQIADIKMDQVVESGKAIVFNSAEFDLKLTNRLNKLLFVDLGGSNAATVRQQKEAEGWKFIKDPKIYVKDVPTKVLIFGKKTA